MGDRRQTEPPAAGRPPRRRRSQIERTESTRRKVLEATLQCIGAKGLAVFSLQDVADTAGLSRGAITHHFPSKRSLCAEAIGFFISWRYEAFQEAFERTAPQDMAGRLDVLWSVFQQIFPITFELIVALRADRELLALVNRRADRDFRLLLEDYMSLFAELSGIELPETVMAMILSFYRGLFFETLTRPAEFTEETRAQFETLLEGFLRAQERPAQ